MGRFDMDWATAKIMSRYAAHLRSVAQKHNELPPDPHYAYLKANSAKRRKDAPRGVRPGTIGGQDHTDTSQEPGPSSARRVSPSSINTARDEEMMDTPGLFGFGGLSDDEDDSDDDGSSDDYAGD
jgi:hypothetical protein